MTDHSTSESIQPAERAISRPAIIAAVFLGLHVLPLLWRPNPLWGVDFLFYLPAPVKGIFILLSILLFISGFRRQVRAWVRYLPFALWGGGRRVWFTRILVVIAALAAFVALASARHFLGDGYHVLEKLDAENWHDAYRAPFTYAVIETLHSLGSVLWGTAENTYRAYSYVSGILYVILCFPIAAALGKNALERSILLVFLLTAGYIQQFFGYVENYALYMPGLLLYLLLGVRTLENRMTLYAPALVLSVLLALHQAFAVFGPSLLFLAYRAHRHGKGGIPPWKNLANTLAALCCVPLTTATFLWFTGVGFKSYLAGMGSGDVLPVFAEPGFDVQYRVFSLAHISDFFNQQLLSAPAACMAIFLGGARAFGVATPSSRSAPSSHSSSPSLRRPTSVHSGTGTFFLCLRYHSRCGRRPHSWNEYAPESISFTAPFLSAGRLLCIPFYGLALTRAQDRRKHVLPINWADSPAMPGPAAGSRWAISIDSKKTRQWPWKHTNVRWTPIRPILIDG